MAGDGMLSGEKPAFSRQISPSFAVCNWAGNKCGVIYPISGAPRRLSEVIENNGDGSWPACQR